MGRRIGVSTVDVGGLRCLAGLIGPSKLSWLGRIAFCGAIVSGAGVIETDGVKCICSTGSGIRGGKSA